MSLTVKSLGMALLLGLFLAGCSDNATEPETDTNPVNAVEIDPIEVSFDAIGQDLQFKANAFDKNGDEISTTFSWTSSDREVVIINSSGLAKATGPGEALVVVSTGGKADTAEVSVNLSEDPTIWWASASSGDWNDPTKWSTGAVPQPEDTVAIALDGTYTVTLSSDVTVRHIVLGATEGTQTLATGTHRFTTDNGKLTSGAELQVNGSTEINGEFNWQGGNITGSGTVEIGNGAVVQAGGESNLNMNAQLINRGVFAIITEHTININGGIFENEQGATIDFQGNGSLVAFSGGRISNSGDVIKSAGDGFSYFYGSSPESFVSTGYLTVEQGMLYLRDCDLNGVINIEEDAELHQAGTTIIRQSLISRGEGKFEIGGKITLGEQAGDLVKLNHVVLNSILSSSISGPGDLSIDGSLLWQKGEMSGSGMVIIGGLADAKLEGSGFKIISERLFVIEGSLETESLLDLRLSNGAQIRLNRFSEWLHTGSGSIRKGPGDRPAIMINKTFRKHGTGALTVEADFICAGEMFIDDGILTVKGNFDLQESGKLVGGSTNANNEINYRRLQVPEAPSAILAGTIDVDANGEMGYLSILGAVTIMPTFKVLIDIDNNNRVPAERLTFPTGGVALDGTLEVKVKGVNLPPAGAKYRVVLTTDGTGKFDAINGAEIFSEIQEDASGVLLIR